MNTDRKYIITNEIAGRKLQRMALEIAERNTGEDQLVLIGIKENGMVIARKLTAYLKNIFKGKVITASLSLNKIKPADIVIEPLTDCSDKVVILVDDVANSGRTMLYSLQPLLKAFPKKIQTAALVERTHKSFPVALDYVGLSISTTLNEHIYVEVENGEVSGAWMVVA